MSSDLGNVLTKCSHEKDEKIGLDVDKRTGVPQLVVISANSQTELQQYRDNCLEFVTNNSGISLQDIAYTTNVERPYFKHRIAIIAVDTIDLITRLENNNTQPGMVVSKETGNQIGFIFSGQGTQYIGMARNLYDVFPVAQTALNYVDALFEASVLEKSVKQIMWEDETLLNQSWYAQAAIFSVQYALTQLWRSFGIRPDYVVGFSFGEIGAAVACGVISVEDGVRFVAGRGLLVRELPIGKMLVIYTSLDIVNRIINEIEKESKDEFWVDLMSITNAPTHQTFSGSPSDIDTLQKACEQKGIKCLPTNATHAFHTRAMDCILDKLEDLASEIRHSSPECVYISMAKGRKLELADFCAEYWRLHIRVPILWSAAIKVLWSSGCRTLIEIGPKPNLIYYAERRLPESVEEVTTCPSISHLEHNWATFFSSLGKLYLQGRQLDWSQWFGDNYHQSAVLLKFPTSCSAKDEVADPD